MDQSKILDIAKALQAASEVRTTMSTPGWKIMRTILEDGIRALSTIDGITTLKELQSRQLSAKTLGIFLAELDGILDAQELHLKTNKVHE